MKVVAVLILMYFMLGFLAGGLIIESRSHRFNPPKPWFRENPPFELPLEILLLVILLGLPVLGYRRARKQGEFLRFSPRVWCFLPPALLIAGFMSSFLAYRFL